MAYIAVGLLAVLCIAILIYVIKVVREDRKILPKKGFRFDDDDTVRPKRRR